MIALLVLLTTIHSELMPYRGTYFGPGAITNRIKCHADYDSCPPLERTRCGRDNVPMIRQYCSTYTLAQPKCYAFDTPIVTRVMCPWPRFADFNVDECVPGIHYNLFNGACRVAWNIIEYTGVASVFDCVCAEFQSTMTISIPQCGDDHTYTQPCGMLYLMRCPNCGPDTATMLMNYTGPQPISRCIRCA